MSKGKTPGAITPGAVILGGAGSPEGALTVLADGFDSRALHAHCTNWTAK